MERKSNRISMYSNEELNNLHKSYEKMSHKELMADYDKLLDEINNMEIDFSEVQGKPIIKMLEDDNLYELPFSMARGVEELYEKLKNGETLDLKDYRVFQKVYTSVQFKTLDQAKMLNEALKQTEELNVKIAEIEEKIKIIADYINRKENENKTGMKYEEGDNDRRLEVEK